MNVLLLFGQTGTAASGDFLGFTFADAIVAAAAVVAIFVSLWANQTAQRSAAGAKEIAEAQRQISARMLSIEEARESDRLLSAVRAELIAAFIAVDAHTVLRVTNRGNGQAREPSIIVNDHDVFTTDLNIYRTKPPDAIGSGAHFDFPWLTYDGIGRHYVVALKWRNEVGTLGEWKSSVSL